jgi:DNA-binding MarR family transcriptional regulator
MPLSQVPDVVDVAGALRVSVGLLARRLRQVRVGDDITVPETAALARLERGGPATAAALAKAEQISPQSMGATLAGLEARGLVARRDDPVDGRRILLSVTAAGLDALRARRVAKTDRLADALAGGFTPAELKQLAAAAPLIERLAERL